MLTFVFLLAIASTILELMIAARIPIWRKLSHKSKLFNLINSMVLSYLVGMAFGAQGLIAMTAGLLSTFMTVPGYAFLYWNYDTPKAKSLPEKSRYQHGTKKWKELGSDTLKMTYGTLKVATAPVWISRKVYRKIKPTASS